MGDEILAGSLGCLGLDVLGLVVVDVVTGGEEGVDIGGGLLDVSLDIHGVTGSFGDGETEVESDGTGDDTQTNEPPPAEVDTVGSTGEILVDDLSTVSGDDNETDNSSGQVTESYSCRCG